MTNGSNHTNKNRFLFELQNLPMINPVKIIPPDIEISIIKDTLALIARSGILTTPIWVANLLVALKSKPLMILVGPQEAAKEILIKNFFDTLIDNDHYRYQTMMGHPWWANQTRDVASYTMAQSRFNTFKLEAMIEEAGLPINRDRLFIAELTQISPGELQEYFTDLAYQLKHGQIMRLPAAHYSEPLPFPPNLTVAATMDTLKFNWLENDLLSQATIIDCAPIEMFSPSPPENFASDPLREKYLIRSLIRDPQRAFRKLFRILRLFPSALSPFLQVKKKLQRNLTLHAHNSMSEGMIYLANSWSSADQGLFHTDNRKNLQIALDLVVTQSLLLPCGEEIAQSASLRTRLHRILGRQFPHSNAFINQLNPA